MSPVGGLIAKLLIEMGLLTAVLAGLLFGAAGTIEWPSGWAYIGLFTALGLGVSLWLAKADPGLLEERLKPTFQAGQKAWDKVFMICLMVVYLGWNVLMGLDARRFAWSHVPVWAQAIGALLLITSFLGVGWVFAANSFAASVIRMQPERGQRVISTGPYAIVRHPMYAFGLLQFAGGPLMLGSWWGLAMVPPAVFALAYRTLGEEKMLRAELDGYEAYARRVRWRYAPGIW
jgi:protein-S-isoprenylcysteine O-methyltransferase Ste14